MSGWADDATARLQDAFESHRNPARAAPIERYMRNQFPFIGLLSSERRALAREALADLAPPAEADLAGALRALWALPEREYQHAGCDLASRWVKVCGPGFVTTLEWLVATKSWWDTVDALAANLAGPLVATHASLQERPNEWIASENLWIRRTALLYQLRYKSRTDAARLERYCLAVAHERDFFIRKAIGWALREYSKTDADRVRAFVAAHDGELSGLSKREALLWLTGRPKRPRSG